MALAECEFVWNAVVALSELPRVLLTMLIIIIIRLLTLSSS